MNKNKHDVLIEFLWRFAVMVVRLKVSSIHKFMRTVYGLTPVAESSKAFSKSRNSQMHAIILRKKLANIRLLIKISPIFYFLAQGIYTNSEKVGEEDKGS